MQCFKGAYFHRPVADGVYLIGCRYLEKTQMESWNIMGDKIEFGVPSGNSWLIVGSCKAVIVDSCAPVQGFREYVESIVNVPVELVLSHGHFDHIYRICEFPQIWMHREDEPLLHGYLGFDRYENPPSSIRYLEEGDVIDLGNRQLRVYHIAGHSNGSIMLLDHRSKILIAGDSIARRLLLYDVNAEKIECYFSKIDKMSEEPFDFICTAHDRIPLKKEYIDFIFDHVIHIENASEQRELFDGMFGRFYSLKEGDEGSEQFINCSVLCEYRDTLVETVKKINDRKKRKRDNYDS